MTSRCCEKLPQVALHSMLPLLFLRSGRSDLFGSRCIHKRPHKQNKVRVKCESSTAMSSRIEGKEESLQFPLQSLGDFLASGSLLGFSAASSQVCLGAAKGDSAGERAERRGAGRQERQGGGGRGSSVTALKCHSFTFFFPPPLTRQMQKEETRRAESARRLFSTCLLCVLIQWQWSCIVTVFTIRAPCIKSSAHNVK